jgi:hypothetical protein
MLNRISALLGLCALLTVAAVAGPTTATAQPSPAVTPMTAISQSVDAGIEGCQGPSAEARLTLSNGTIYGYNCSGTYYPYRYTIRFDAGGWSGYIINNGVRRNFCDWNSFSYATAWTTVLYFSPTKASWC